MRIREATRQSCTCVVKKGQEAVLVDDNLPPAVLLSSNERKARKEGRGGSQV